MKIDRITKAQIALAVVSWLALLQMVITSTCFVPMVIMVLSFAGYKALCDHEQAIRRRKYLARKGGVIR